MCGIVGLLLAAEDGHANQELFDSLTALQHRGQGESLTNPPHHKARERGSSLVPRPKAGYRCSLTQQRRTQRYDIQNLKHPRGETMVVSPRVRGCTGPRNLKFLGTVWGFGGRSLFAAASRMASGGMAAFERNAWVVSDFPFCLPRAARHATSLHLDFARRDLPTVHAQLAPHPTCSLRKTGCRASSADGLGS